jgi:predicted nuclease of predicted toxin-antitoxin system
VNILLDECVPARLSRSLPQHDVVTAHEAGFAGVKNGELLRLAAADFDAFVTVDRNLAFQQNPDILPIAVIVINSRSNKLKDIEPHVTVLLQTLDSALERRVYHIGSLRLA